MDQNLLVTTEYDFRDIPGSESWVRLSEIMDGDSSDRKFYIKNINRERFFLRVADCTSYDRKKDEYELLSAIHGFGAPVPHPVGFGLCNRGRSLYLMTSWIYGNKGTTALQNLTKYQQYALGTDAGLCLKLVHSCEYPARKNVWCEQQMTRLDKIVLGLTRQHQISALENKLIGMLTHDRSLLQNRPEVLMHGDFHTDNVVLSFENRFSLIDFDNWQYGDPMADLANVLTRIYTTCPSYAIGVIDCYFAFMIDPEDWSMMRLYAAMNLAEQVIAVKHQPAADKLAVKNQLQLFMHDFQNGRSLSPLWYKRMRISPKLLLKQEEED